MCLKKVNFTLSNSGKAKDKWRKREGEGLNSFLLFCQEVGSLILASPSDPFSSNFWSRSAPSRTLCWLRHCSNNTRPNTIGSVWPKIWPCEHYTSFMMHKAAQQSSTSNVAIKHKTNAGPYLAVFSGEESGWIAGMATKIWNTSV